MAQRGRGDDYPGRDPERLLLIPGSRGGQAKKRVPWHQKPHAGCLVLAVLSLFGLGAVLLPSFESPGNITVFRAAEADVRVRQLAGWREDLEAPAPEAMHAVTLAVKQDREAILAALATTSDPDSPRYGQHYSREEVAAISTPKRSAASVRAFVEKATSGLRAARVSWSPGRDYVRVEARVEDLDKIFNAEFRRWERVLGGEVVHETYRTRELAVPKDLEAHLDCFLGALHLPSGQLRHRDAESEDAGSAARIANARENGSAPAEADASTEGPTGTATSTLAAASAAVPAVPAGGVARSAYSDRAPVRIGEPPRRVRVSERDRVLREARALADEAAASGGGGGGGDANGGLNTHKRAFRVEASDDADEDAATSAPTETGSGASPSARGEPHADATFSRDAVDETLTRVRASARDVYAEKERETEGETTKRGDADDATRRRDENTVSGARGTRRTLAEADEDAKSATVDDASSASSVSSVSSSSSSSRSASSSAKRAAALKAAERKRRGAEARGELEDKANAMFQKLDDGMREMKTLMAEVVHTDVIGDVDDGGDDASEEELDEEDVPDRSGDGEADVVGSADPIDARTRSSRVSNPISDEETSVRDETSDSASGSIASHVPDASLPVVEAGSEAAKRAAKRVGEVEAGSSAPGSAAPDDLAVPGDVRATPPGRGGAPSRTASPSLPSAPATRDARVSSAFPRADAVESAETLAEAGDGGEYYEYELNYDAETSEADRFAETRAFEAPEGAREASEARVARARREDVAPTALFDGESAAARSTRAAQVEARLRALVTPDKVLRYYNVPRAAATTRPGATLGIAAFAGDTARLRATIWKYAEYFNVSVGAVRAVEQEDAIAAEARGLAGAGRAQDEAPEADASAAAGARGDARRDANARAAPMDAADPRDALGRGGATGGRMDDASASTLGGAGGSASRGGADAKRRFSETRLSGGVPRTRAPSKTEKMEAAAQSAVANAVSSAVEAAVDAADAFAEGVGLAVEKGDWSFAGGSPRRGDPAGKTRSPSASEQKRDPNGAIRTDGDPRPAFRSDAEVAATAKDEDIFLERDVSARGETPFSQDVASAAGAAPLARGGGGASVSSETPSPRAPVTAADLGWQDLASSRLESSLDVQAAAATARGGAVDLFLASPSQHYGWEALDVALSLAARPDPPSVLSVSFGGAERRRAGGAGGDLSDDRVPDERLESLESLEATRATREARTSPASAARARARPGAGGAARLGASGDVVGDETDSRTETRSGDVARGNDTRRATFDARRFGGDDDGVAGGVFGFRVSASARGETDARAPRPSYVKTTRAWDALERVDTEMAKLGLRGVTVVAASGDNGPFSFGIPNPYQSWFSPDTPCSFQPSLPGSMPHVVAVGGTTGGKDPMEPERAAAVESGGKITTGGGFSDVFPQPEWQKLAVQRYLKQYSYDLPPESFFNASNRAYPDVALAAEDVAVVFAASGAETEATRASSVPGSGSRHAASDAARGVDASGTEHRLDVRPGVDDALARRARHYLTESSGTSYAAPLFAGMIALINDERLSLNKTTVGFVSPALYALHRSDGAAVFNDIKQGSSKCPNANMCGAMVGCCKHGFRAGKGWDPLTGLGSVDFQRLRDELVRLP